MEKVSGGKLFSPEIKPIFGKPEVTSGKESPREHRRKSGSPGCDKRKLSNFSKLWYNVESRTPTLSTILSVTAIGWKMKDEPVIKNTDRAPISEISILKIAIVSGE